MKLGLSLIVAVIAIVALAEGQDANKRCKYFEWVRACKVSCKVLGHTTGKTVSPLWTSKSS